MTEQLKGPTSALVPRARFLFVTQFWQKLSRVGSGARLLGSLSKGVFTWNRGELNPVPCHGSIFVYMIPPQNVMPARVTPAWVHPGCFAGARISLVYKISQRYHVNAKRPPVSVWNRSARKTGTEGACVMFAIMNRMGILSIWSVPLNNEIWNDPVIMQTRYEIKKSSRYDTCAGTSFLK